VKTERSGAASQRGAATGHLMLEKHVMMVIKTVTLPHVPALQIVPVNPHQSRQTYSFEPPATSPLRASFAELKVA
jgi:hypothetical protein